MILWQIIDISYAVAKETTDEEVVEGMPTKNDAERDWEGYGMNLKQLIGLANAGGKQWGFGTPHSVPGE
jgi:hypothetical protein